MARKGFQQQLTELRENVLYMSEIVLERMRKGLRALDEKNEALAREVIEGDHEINEIYLELEQDCIDLFALQQPVAGDLRFIAASFKIITDLERVADLATNLGDYTLQASRDMYPDVDIQGIGVDVIEMVEDAMDAYAEEDTDACFEINDRDDEVDARCERASSIVVRDLIETEIDSDSSDAEIEALMAEVSRLLLTIRDLERVGDHAVNIAARTLYMVENSDELIY
ncbi:MAG: phosphate signaling complex protein PhoU [Natronomonas sp.]|jgi:phosphate transport system protein|uniref:Phosphate-specific transport system accessory protein PhoU n=1 Tax=Natronomonas salsuginis TaxID=2217661 RepID=A0A4U5JIN2_9EURY|nr:MULTISPECIES: phosphate signaling complex protein PhoU [Natronomonas]MDR9431338.1 phosphate signaling complex protein PhoU [Natronomonas sp.]TKR27938.1 phosphate signaling complex protein PhoU [Natronomonas salsuginis]